MSKTLEKFNYSVEKALASYANIDEQEAKTLSKNMSLSDYMSLVNALDENNEEEITRVVDKYTDTPMVAAEGFRYFNEDIEISQLKHLEERFFNFLENATIEQISESTIFPNIIETDMYLPFVADVIKEAIQDFDTKGIDHVYESISLIIDESADLNKARDVYIMKYVVENIDFNTKQAISKITNTPSNQITKPSFTNPKTNKSEEIVSADMKSNTIATKDSSGNVNIVDLKDQDNKKQITVEGLKSLAGLK